MAVNLINSNDIKVEQTGQDIQLKTSTPISTLEGGISDNANNIQNIINGEKYLTTEVKTNKIWIDNKPIYRKVITGTTSSTNGNTWNYVNLDTPNINEILPMTTIKYGPSDNEVNIGNVNDSYGFQYRIINKNQLMYRQYGYKNIPYTLLLEYTKTS